MYKLKMEMRPLGVNSWTAEMSLVPSTGIWAHLLTSSEALIRMTDLLTVLLVRWDDGYITCHREFALVLPKESI